MSSLLSEVERSVCLAALAVLRLRGRRLREAAEQGGALSHLHLTATALEVEVLVERLARHIQAHSDKNSACPESRSRETPGSPTQT